MIPAAAPCRDPRSGLSLIEVLIGLVILGVATTGIVLGLNSAGRDRRTEDQALRLAAHLSLAVDEGLVSRRPLALFWTPEGYEMKRWQAGDWQAAQSPRLARAHVLPTPVVLRRMDGARDAVLVAEDGLGPAVDLELSGSGPAWIVAFDGYSATVRPAGPR